MIRRRGWPSGAAGTSGGVDDGRNHGGDRGHRQRGGAGGFHMAVGVRAHPFCVCGSSPRAANTHATLSFFGQPKKSRKKSTRVVEVLEMVFWVQKPYKYVLPYYTAAVGDDLRNWIMESVMEIIFSF